MRPLDAKPIVWAVVLTACAPPESPMRWLGFPGDGTAKTAIIASRSPTLELEVVDLEDPTFTELDLGDRPPYRAAHVLLYADTPRQLGYEPGPLVAGTSEADSIPLVSPNRGVYATSIDEESLEVSWLQNTNVPDDIADFRVRVSDECALFGAATVQESVEGIVYFRIPIDDEHVVVRSTRDVLIVSRDGVVNLNGMTELDRMWSAYLAPNGDLYLGDFIGGIWRGRVSAETGVTNAVLLRDTDLGQIVSMDGNVDADGNVELVMLDRNARAGWLSGEDFTDLGQIDPPRVPVVWAEPGVAYIAAEGIDKVLRLSPTGVTTENIGAGSQVWHLSGHDQLGVVAGTAEGHFFALNAPRRRWGQLEGADFGWWGVGSAPYEDGFAFMLASGFIGTYKPARGFCEAMPFLRIIEAGGLAAAGEDLVVTAVPDDEETTSILYIPRL